MPFIFIPESNEYNPLELEPYRSFNRRFEDREDDIDGALIKLSIPNQRNGLLMDLVLIVITMVTYCPSLSWTINRIHGQSGLYLFIPTLTWNQWTDCYL